MYTLTYIYVCLYVYVYIYRYTCIYIHVKMPGRNLWDAHLSKSHEYKRYTSTHTHTHTHTNTHTHSWQWKVLTKVKKTEMYYSLAWTATHCNRNTLPHTATHCNTLQHTATHNTLQRTAIHMFWTLAWGDWGASHLYFATHKKTIVWLSSCVFKSQRVESLLRHFLCDPLRSHWCAPTHCLPSSSIPNPSIMMIDPQEVVDYTAMVWSAVVVLHTQ